MTQFFKEPLVENRVCKACSQDLFKPLRMPQSIYEEVKKYPMPMPIPKPTSIGDTSANLHYMSFEEAQALPFTSQHQPSLQESLLRIATGTKRREAGAKSKLGAARVATTLSPNITIEVEEQN